MEIWRKIRLYHNLLEGAHQNMSVLNSPPSPKKSIKKYEKYTKQIYNELQL